jgi:hypothetical protein
LGGVASTGNSNGGTGGDTYITIIKNTVSYIITAQGGQGGITGSVSIPTFAGAGGFNSAQTYTVNPYLDISPLFTIIGGAGFNSCPAITSNSYSTGGSGASSIFGGGSRGATSTTYPPLKCGYGTGGGGGSNGNINGSNGGDGIGIFTYIQ